MFPLRGLGGRAQHQAVRAVAGTVTVSQGGSGGERMRLAGKRAGQPVSDVSVAGSEGGHLGGQVPGTAA